MRLTGRSTVAALASAAILLVTAGSASAAGPTGLYAPFTNCDIDALAAEPTPAFSDVGCAHGEVNGGSFTIGRQTVPITHQVVTDFGFWTSPDGYRIVAPLDGQYLKAQPETVPGGLLGLQVPVPKNNPLGAVLAQTLNQAFSTGLLGVKAQVEAAGPVSDFTGLQFALPVKIHLINPLLGSSCYIGSDADPIVLNPALVDATGLDFPLDESLPDERVGVLTVNGATLQDTTFAVPKAAGCGPSLIGTLVDAAINAKLGLPSASGKNAALFKPAELRILDSLGPNPGPALKAGYDASIR